MIDDLLQPSLDAATASKPLYSPTACWMTAFFGGPIAALVIFSVNFQRAKDAAATGRVVTPAPMIFGETVSAIK